MGLLEGEKIRAHTITYLPFERVVPQFDHWQKVDLKF